MRPSTTTRESFGLRADIGWRGCLGIAAAVALIAVILIAIALSSFDDRFESTAAFKCHRAGYRFLCVTCVVDADGRDATACDDPYLDGPRAR
jgi:hypothetical protein